MILIDILFFFVKLPFRLFFYLLFNKTTWLILFLVILGFVIVGLYRRWFVYLFFKREKVKGSKTVLITGGNGGIGLELAKLFIKDEYHVIICGRNTDKLKSAKEELEKMISGSNNFVQKVYAWRYDISELENVNKMVTQLEEEEIHVDILINNAGFGEYSYFEKMEKCDSMISTNCTALVKLTRLILPKMIEKGEGKIMNVASGLGFFPVPYNATYGATKAFVRSFSRALTFEMSIHKNIVVNLLSPGITDTEFGSVASSKYSDKKGFQEVTSTFKKIPKQSAKDCAWEGYKGLMMGEMEVISGLNNYIRAGIVAQIIPNFVIAGVMKKAFKGMLDRF